MLVECERLQIQVRQGVVRATEKHRWRWCCLYVKPPEKTEPRTKEVKERHEVYRA